MTTKSTKGRGTTTPTGESSSMGNTTSIDAQAAATASALEEGPPTPWQRWLAVLPPHSGKLLVQTTHGGLFRRGGIVFSSDPREIKVADFANADELTIDPEQLYELLEAARPAEIINPNRSERASKPTVPSGRVLRVVDAATKKQLHPIRDMADAGFLEDLRKATQRARKTQEEEPAAVSARQQREAGARNYDLDDEDEGGSDYEDIV